MFRVHIVCYFLDMPRILKIDYSMKILSHKSFLLAMHIVFSIFSVMAYLFSPCFFLITGFESVSKIFSLNCAFVKVCG